MRRHDDDAPRDEPPGGPSQPAGRGVTPRQVLGAIAVLVLVIFAAANFRSVEVNFLFFTARARVVTVIVVAGLLGFAIGYVVGRPGRAERRRLREGRDED
jgi:uncharacterized integral membrane protein